MSLVTLRPPPHLTLSSGLSAPAPHLDSSRPFPSSPRGPGVRLPGGRAFPHRLPFTASPRSLLPFLTSQSFVSFSEKSGSLRVSWATSCMLTQESSRRDKLLVGSSRKCRTLALGVGRGAQKRKPERGGRCPSCEACVSVPAWRPGSRHRRSRAAASCPPQACAGRLSHGRATHRGM